MNDIRQDTPAAPISNLTSRNRSTIVVIAFSTMLIAATQLIQTFVFWIVNLGDAAVIIHLTPWRALWLQTVTPIALLGLLVASFGLAWRKQWGRPLFVWTAVVWMLMVTLLSYWIMAVVNLPVYLLAIWLLYRKSSAGLHDGSCPTPRLNVRHIASVTCMALACTLHLWAWLAAMSSTSWVWRLIPHGHPWHLLVPSAMLLIAGTLLAFRSNRRQSAGIALIVSCVAMGSVLLASSVTSTFLSRYMPAPRPHGFIPYGFMAKYLTLLGGVAFWLLCPSFRTRLNGSKKFALTE